MCKTIIKKYYIPVYVFQMGKVGSTSLVSTLSANYKGVVVCAHNYGGMCPSSQRLLKWRKGLRLPVYVICPVREPLSRNVSAFFENFKRDSGVEFSEREWTAPELRDMFLRHYPHNICLEWFDRNFRTTFDIDVFSKPFPVERKWDTYRKGSVRVLVYRSDLGYSEQLAVISQFIGCKIDSWNYRNKAEDKEYKNSYKEFCTSVTLPDIYISVMCASRFCQHFWSKEEIAEFSKRWKE